MEIGVTSNSNSCAYTRVPFSSRGVCTWGEGGTCACACVRVCGSFFARPFSLFFCVNINIIIKIHGKSPFACTHTYTTHHGHHGATTNALHTYTHTHARIHQRQHSLQLMTCANDGGHHKHTHSHTHTQTGTHAQHVPLGGQHDTHPFTFTLHFCSGRVCRCIQTARLCH